MKNGKYTLIVAPNGYPGKHYRGRYSYEHTVEFWKKEKRLPLAGHVVHHINGLYTDNSWDNLEEMLRSDHSLHHKQDVPLTHGAHSAYRRGCRCDECKAFHTAEHQKYRLKKKLIT